MNILAHRGFWKETEEKNSLRSIGLAFDNGFGIETDIRDYQGKLVISHNVADEKCPLVEDMFKLYVDSNCSNCLALNVKADGLQSMLKELFEKYEISNYFLFDMSIPELVVNERERLIYYTRHSDIEAECVMYEHAKGVWLDSFYDENWLTKNIVEEHVAAGKHVCIVSPELHGYEYEATWRMLKECGFHKNELVTLCTDKPDVARRYFYE